MVRFFTSLIVTVVIMTMVVIAWTPVAKSGFSQFQDCLDFCEDQAICQCAKILGGSLRLTKCNIGAACEYVRDGDECVCDVDPICALWEKDVVSQKFPPEPPFANNCSNGG